MKTTRDQLDIINAYQELGTYRAAARLCGTSDKTVKRVLERRLSGSYEYRARPPAASNTEIARELVAEKVRATEGLISAKRLLPVARAAGYQGSLRNLRRLVAKVKADWQRRRRVYRPWHPLPGEHLVCDWTQHGRLHLFCAVLPWSRWRFVRFARDEKRETTLQLLAECFEELGGVPAVVLTDRMGCLRAGTVANVVVPHPDYVRFAAHYRFRPDFCEAADPESKGVVEHLCGYAQRDLAALLESDDVDAANRAAVLWCLEVNAAQHSEICAVPQVRLEEESKVLRPLPSLRPPLRRGELRKVDKMQTVRFGSARYSVPTAYVGHQVEVNVGEAEVVVIAGEREIARHPLCAPGGASILDEHYGGARGRPSRPVRVRTTLEREFLSLGPSAEAFLRAAAAAGTSRLAGELADIVTLERSWGRDALLLALSRAVEFRRFRAQDMRSILAANGAAPRPTAEGGRLELVVPEVPVRPLSAYSLEALR
ncbi:MAG TPA: IS21 family transposase [Candidatus Dormibacteraeota bacterium]